MGRVSVNIVVKPGWILERMARELETGIPGVTVNATGYLPEGPGRQRIHYFMPMKDLRRIPDVAGIKIGLFTHGEERANLFAGEFDACTTMNEKMAIYLRENGAKDVTFIQPGTEPPKRPIVFGVCGRVYGKGRKGAWMVERAVAEGFHFVACSEAQKREDKRPPCPITHGINRRDRFYPTIDYLVVTSTDEGGPMPVLEAIAHGTPVIAPDVGFCWQFPVLKYERGSWESLRDVLLKLTKPPTWAGWVEGHRELFARVLSERLAA